MEQLTTRCRTLAEKIYTLDENVYKALGSSLGRTLIGSREKVLSVLEHELSLRPQGQLILSDMALIGNMARTLPEGASRKQLLTEYNDIIVALKALEEEIAKGDISDQKRVFLNPFATGAKPFSKDDHLVICIGRSYGSGGTEIGFQLADDLHINYYDATIFKDVLERLQAKREATEKHDIAETLHEMRHAHGLKLFTANFNRFHGLPTADALFFNQSQYIEELARKEDFVVMGRSADVILKNAGIPHISIFITAPFESRVKRLMEMHELSFKEAAKLVKREDKAHEHFYHRYTGFKWGSAVHYDLCINSASYGIHESEELIIRVIKARLREDLQALATRHQEFVEKADAELLARRAEQAADGI